MSGFDKIEFNTPVSQKPAEPRQRSVPSAKQDKAGADSTFVSNRNMANKKKRNYKKNLKYH